VLSKVPSEPAPPPPARATPPPAPPQPPAQGTPPTAAPYQPGSGGYSQPDYGGGVYGSVYSQPGFEQGGGPVQTGR
jgi:hypothetical protein